MAFPTVGAPTASQQTGNSGTSNVALPANIATGDLIIATIAADVGAGAMTWPAPWVKLAERIDTAHVMSVGYLIAVGGETTVGVTHSNERSNHLAWRVTGWHGTTPPEVSSLANATSNAPNSGALTPSWGADDTLWMSLATWDDSAAPTVSTYPANYTDGQGTNVTASSAGRVAGAARALNAASEDPGAFGLSGSETWAAFTVAIRPAAAGGGPITGTATFVQAAASWSASGSERLPSTAAFTQAAASWAATASEKDPSTATFVQPAASWDAAASEKLPSTAAFTQAAPIWSAVASTPSAANDATASFVQAAGSWAAIASEKFSANATFVQAAASWGGSASETHQTTATFAQAAASWSASASQGAVVPTVSGTAVATILDLHIATATVSSASIASATVS